MKLQSLSFSDNRGWSEPIDRSLDSDTTLAIAFCGSRFDHARPLRELRAALPATRLLACSTAGEIFGSKVLDDSVAAAVLRFDRTAIRVASAHVDRSKDSYGAGLEIAKQLADPKLRAVFVVSNGTGVGVNGSDLVAALNEVFGGSVIVTGGLAGDGSRFERTWVALDDANDGTMIAAVGLYGDHLQFGHGSKGGWDIFGLERVVTKSRGNVLYELDGRPALRLYKEYLGDRADGLPATGLLFPLALRSDRESDKRLVRTILAVDEAQQSLTFAGDIPEGSLAQLMRANFDRLVEGASNAASVARLSATTPTLSIAISCVGRRLVLGQRVEEETEAVLDSLPPNTHQIGFYSYGEISPYTDGNCDLHNQTMTLTTISET